MKKKLLIVVVLLMGCANGRNMTSKHFLPAWENHFINVPDPSETSGGYWAVKTMQAVTKGTEKVILFPMAIVGNAAANAYYIPTWPVRWLVRGDKRLIVWYPLFSVGEEVGSGALSKEWNRDLV